MNIRRISRGVIILYIGVVILLSNLDVIQFSWWYALSFWPVFLILIGLNIMLPNKMEGQILSVIATCLTLAFFTYQGLHPKSKTLWAGIVDKHSTQTQDIPQSSYLSEPMEDQITSASLDLSAGAVKLQLEAATQDLIDLESSIRDGGFLLSKTGSDSHPKLRIEHKRNDKRNFNSSSDDDAVQVRLNPEVNWDLSFSLGAADAKLDLSAFKVSRLALECGVSSVTLRLGMPANQVSQVELEGGLASIELELPKDAGCRIGSEASLSSLKTSGFVKKGRFYESENYAEADKKIEIDIDSGLSSIDISRY